MKKQMKIYGFNCRIIKLTILGLLVFSLLGCQQVTNLTNGNTNVGQTNSAANINSAANTNSAANANSETAKTVPNNLVGTWIGTSPEKKLKIVFTENELTEYDGDKQETIKYKLIDEQTIEVTNKDTGKSAQVKATVVGDELTVVRPDGEIQKLKRESGNADANTSSIEAIKKKLIGTWTVNVKQPKKEIIDGRPVYSDVWKDIGELFTFDENNQYCEFIQPHPMSRGVYKIADAETLKLLNRQNKFLNLDKITDWKIKFEDDNTIILDSDRKLKRKSNDSKFPAYFFTEYYLEFWGNWIGVPGTNSENESISTQHMYLGHRVNNETRIFSIVCDPYSEQRNVCKMRLENGEDNNPNRSVSVGSDVLTIEDNGVVKKYNRLTEIK